MDLKNAVTALEAGMATDTPVMMWGEAGVGKSSIVHQLAVDYDVELRDERLSQIESVDLRGLPSLHNGKTTWNIPDFLPDDPKSMGILFLDELPQADPAVQSAAYQLVLDRKLGKYTLPKRWRILAAGNPGQERMAEALGNRFMHIDVMPSVNNWVVWGAQASIHSDILGFVASRPELLHARPTNQDEYAFPSPRTWEYASRIYVECATSPLLQELIAATVGKGAALEFVAYVNLLSKLPTIQQIIDNPSNFISLNSSPSKVAAICMMIVNAVDHTNVDALMDYVKTVQLEFQVLTIIMINETKNNLMGTTKITDWCMKNQSVFN